MCVFIWQLRHANACFRQELCDSEPLVAHLRDVLDKQRSLLSVRDGMSSELYNLLIFCLMTEQIQ